MIVIQLAASEATHRARLALKNISTTAQHLRQTIHPDMGLTFHSRPTSVADLVPEPKEGAFISFYLWLEQQRHDVVNLEFESTDDLELASFHMSVLEMLDMEISKLETMKTRAWAKLAVEAMIGAHVRGRDDGPLHVKSDPDKPDDPYPHTCTFQETDQPEHAPTQKDTPGKVTYEPNVVYPYRKLESWLTDLVSRRGFVDRMREAWSPFTGRWRDIFHAPAVRTFLGPYRKTPFSSQPDNSVHIVLSLFIDWFNPFRNKKAGKSHSIGAVYLICENLPDHLRYKPEYMCLLSIIPGPKEPTLHQINHLLHPLVDELLVLWHQSILFEKVSPDYIAVLVRAAVIPLVCDLPALRKAAGFAGHMASHFCSFCQLLKDRINDLDRSRWPTRSWKEHLRHARKWRDAPTEAARTAEFKDHGIRWSELLRLEYWDPTQFAVVDAMHNLLLGNLRHHCHDVWGLDVKDKASDSSKAQPHSPEQQLAQLRLVEQAITNQSKKTWGKIRKGYVVAVAEFNGVSPSGASLSKTAYATALLDHFANTPDSVKLPPVLAEATSDFHLAENAHDISKHRVLDQLTITQIRQDISNTIFPSWIERPPRNFGSPSHGKLKADQWRTVSTQLNTNNQTEQMPVTFIRYFHIGSTLRWLMGTIEWPTSAPFRKMVSSYHDAVKSIRAAGIRIADFIPFSLAATDSDSLLRRYDERKEKELPRQVYDALFTLISSSSVPPFSSVHAATADGSPILPSAVNNIGSIERDGVTFATREAGFRNSFVLFNDPMSAIAPPFPLAGQISQIFLHSRRENGRVILETFLHIDEFKSLDPAHIQHDPYRQFPDINTRLLYNEVHATPRIVWVWDVKCHFATLKYTPEDIGAECIVVRSLDRE
ncbi:hypothetical protein GSI_01201 [Ganoderma sinense ZZ0214-1]|uniref:Uncharacterized protein n=1 Tax=Ganoderma sinense ZZ0214-1 TaxID=1077348 RepID=A0A2G8SUR6_9APHY|nr:hypothetical protein GSI_01201 [Ganoderma sinense ZZ0214-1]